MLGGTNERIWEAYNQLFEDMLKDETGGEDLLRILFDGADRSSSSTCATLHDVSLTVIGEYEWTYVSLRVIHGSLDSWIELLAVKLSTRIKWRAREMASG